MARKKTLAMAEAQYARITTDLAARTPNPSVGLSSLSNMGGPNGTIANRYARATNGLMKIKAASRAKGAVAG
jgi:hypothetical protein